MNRAVILAAIVAALASGCGQGDSDNVSWNATFTGSEESGTSTTGGGIISVNKTLVLPPWLVEAPVPYDDPLPPPDLNAVGDAIFAAMPGYEVIDAAISPRGTVALYRNIAGSAELLLLAETEEPTEVPAEARRIVVAGVEPLRVYVILPDGSAVLATHD